LPVPVSAVAPPASDAVEGDDLLQASDDTALEQTPATEAAAGDIRNAVEVVGDELSQSSTDTGERPQAAAASEDPLSGGTVEAEPDGGTVEAEPDGLAVEDEPDGLATTAEPDGLATTAEPDGLVTAAEPDGLVTAAEPDGLATAAEPDGGTVEAVGASDLADQSLSEGDPEDPTVAVADTDAGGAEQGQRAPRRTRSTSVSADGSGGRPASAPAGRPGGARAKIGRPKSASATSDAEEHLSAATAVYVPLEVRELIAARRRALDPAPTTAEIVLRAIEAQYERLPQLVQEAMRPETGSLFTFTSPVRTNEVKVQMGLRLTRGQLRTLDRIEEQVGASSRGQLVALAVRAELGGG